MIESSTTCIYWVTLYEKLLKEPGPGEYLFEYSAELKGDDGAFRFTVDDVVKKVVEIRDCKEWTTVKGEYRVTDPTYCCLQLQFHTNRPTKTMLARNADISLDVKEENQCQTNTPGD